MQARSVPPRDSVMCWSCWPQASGNIGYPQGRSYKLLALVAGDRCTCGRGLMPDAKNPISMLDWNVRASIPASIT